MATIYLIRHGQASFGTDNYDRLSDLGSRQAEVLGEYFRDHGIAFDAVYSGDLQRQRETARLALQNQARHVPHHIDPRFNEVRNRAFSELGFSCGDAHSVIPASTGIEGRNLRSSWCTLDLLASRPLPGGTLDVGRMLNPRQNEAPEYGSAFTPTAAMEFRTQFAPGYDYTGNPFDDGRDPPVEVSEFLAPAYFTQSLGLSYDPESWFKSRLTLPKEDCSIFIPDPVATEAPVRGPS